MGKVLKARYGIGIEGKVNLWAGKEVIKHTGSIPRKKNAY